MKVIEILGQTPAVEVSSTIDPLEIRGGACFEIVGSVPFVTIVEEGGDDA